ncbi:unnamed protein product [Rhizoctonia solani]|uniref:Uncharacterized protein n=1 Tax=Rhizoctonia solani TaxID=456999 RepID=A0A8H3H9H2_9AGAM|nr:unnamed protein product [Rhizoctonia solani]
MTHLALKRLSVVGHVVAIARLPINPDHQVAPTMNLGWIMIHLLISLPQALCLWGRNTGQTVSTLSISDNRRDSGLAHEDLGAIKTKLSALKLHSERSDCFKDASSTLYSSCESLNFGPSERVKGMFNGLGGFYRFAQLSYGTYHSRDRNDLV